MKVFILIDGISKEMPNNMPKAFLSIPKFDKESKNNSETILDRMIRIFNDNNISGINLVVGYKWKDVIKLYPNYSYVMSDPSGTTGSLRSLYNSLCEFGVYSDNLVILGNTVFNDDALKYIDNISADNNELGIAFFGDDDGIYALRISKKGVNTLKKLEHTNSIDDKTINDCGIMDLYNFLHNNFNLGMNKINAEGSAWIKSINTEEEYDKICFNIPIADGVYDK